MYRSELYFFYSLLWQYSLPLALQQKQKGKFHLLHSRRYIKLYTTEQSPIILWGAALGLQVQMNTKIWIRRVAELNTDIFAGTHELILDENDKSVNYKGTQVGLYGGALFQPAPRLLAGAELGINIYNRKACFSLRPSVQYAFSKNNRWPQKYCLQMFFNATTIATKVLVI